MPLIFSRISSPFLLGNTGIGNVLSSANMSCPRWVLPENGRVVLALVIPFDYRKTPVQIFMLPEQ
jgi:hypothetical protein